MEDNRNNQSGTAVVDSSNRHAVEVVRAAQSELRDLLRKRSEIMRRIGSVKRTIVGLARMFGEDIVKDEWMELRNRRKSSDQPGFTKSCRRILMEAEGPLTSREVCERLRARIGELDLRHKDPLASVTTVLNRLVEYGEARIVCHESGRRTWAWAESLSPVEGRSKTLEKTAVEQSSPFKNQ